MTTAEDIRDDLVTHDIDLRRLDGDVRRKVERRLDELGSDLRALAVKIDPHGAMRTDARQRRIAKLEQDSKPIIREAYTEIARLTRDTMRRTARAESKAVVTAIGENLP